MSGNYYRKVPPRSKGPKEEGYGFKKVSQDQLDVIVSRLATPTYNSRMEQYERHTVHNYRYAKSAPPPRSPSHCNRRYSVGSQSGQLLKDKKFSEQDVQRIIRRVRRPTTASQLARRDYDYYVDEFVPPLEKQISNTATAFFDASDRKKAFDQLSRPTTASRAKNKIECHLCTDEDRELNLTLLPFDYPYAPDDKNVSKEEFGEIISRVSSHTRASHGGTVQCWKTPPDYKPLRKQSANLPLVSGLDRSKSVAQIVRRLHSAKGSQRMQRAPAATAITDFYARS